MHTIAEYADLLSLLLKAYREYADVAGLSAFPAYYVVDWRTFERLLEVLSLMHDGVIPVWDGYILFKGMPVTEQMDAAPHTAYIVAGNPPQRT